jgi:hypothetical protein
MIVTMHAATAALAAAAVAVWLGPECRLDIAAIALADIAAGHLSTLAFSSPGPAATSGRRWHRCPRGRRRPLDASKSWVTSVGQADSYVWSSYRSRPTAR